MSDNDKTKWYIGGLHFECSGCGGCCAGPDEGYIWITKLEIRMLASHLNLSVDACRSKYLRLIGKRTTIIEDKPSNNCIFLVDVSGQRQCAVYPVRPNQCRTWPFWSMNLATSADWNIAAMTCPGINRGQFHSFQQIEEKRTQKKWWTDAQTGQ